MSVVRAVREQFASGSGFITAIGGIVDQLLGEHILLEGALKVQGVGRPPVSLRYNRSLGYFDSE